MIYTRPEASNQKGILELFPWEGADTRLEQIGEVLNAEIDAERPALPGSCPPGKVIMAGIFGDEALSSVSAVPGR
jgi:hypothetical protein